MCLVLLGVCFVKVCTDPSDWEAQKKQLNIYTTKWRAQLHNPTWSIWKRGMFLLIFLAFSTSPQSRSPRHDSSLVAHVAMWKVWDETPRFWTTGLKAVVAAANCCKKTCFFALFFFELSYSYLMLGWCPISCSYCSRGWVRLPVGVAPSGGKQSPRKQMPWNTKTNSCM